MLGVLRLGAHREAEVGGMHLQATEHWGPQKQGRGWEAPSLEPQRRAALPNSGFLSPKNAGFSHTHACCFKPPAG